MRAIILVCAILLSGCGNAPEAVADEIQPEPRGSFFLLTSPDAKSVFKCRAAALAFDAQRTPEQARLVVKACEADADAASDHDCAMYAVSVASGAEKFIGQIEAARTHGMMNLEPVKFMQDRAAEYAPKCAV